MNFRYFCLWVWSRSDRKAEWFNFAHYAPRIQALNPFSHTHINK